MDEVISLGGIRIGRILWDLEKILVFIFRVMEYY